MRKLKVKVLYHPLKNDNFDLKEILFEINKLGFSRAYVESGLNLISNFLKMKLVDDFYLFISNKKIGLNGKNNFKKIMKIFFKKKMYKETVNLFGDKLFTCRLK